MDRRWVRGGMLALAAGLAGAAGAEAQMVARAMMLQVPSRLEDEVRSAASTAAKELVISRDDARASPHASGRHRVLVLDATSEHFVARAREARDAGATLILLGPLDAEANQPAPRVARLQAAVATKLSGIPVAIPWLLDDGEPEVRLPEPDGWTEGVKDLYVRTVAMPGAVAPWPGTSTMAPPVPSYSASYSASDSASYGAMDPMRWHLEEARMQAARAEARRRAEARQQAEARHRAEEAWEARRQAELRSASSSPGKGGFERDSPLFPDEYDPKDTEGGAGTTGREVDLR